MLFDLELICLLIHAIKLIIAFTNGGSFEMPEIDIGGLIGGLIGGE